MRITVEQISSRVVHTNPFAGHGTSGHRPLGSTLPEPMRHIKEWAEVHMPEVDTARAACDRNKGGPARRSGD